MIPTEDMEHNKDGINQKEPEKFDEVEHTEDKADEEEELELQGESDIENSFIHNMLDNSL